MNIKLLKKLYLTHSPSKKEHKMAELITNELTNLNIEFKQDNLMQIHRILPGKPLMVAHMDQVQQHACHKVMSFKNRLYGFSKKGKLTGLGADDKNGIFIILSMLAQHRDELSFIFSANEEGGGFLQNLLPDLDLDDTPYALIFDRRGNSDIIGTSNDYCCEDLETAVEVISDKLKYRATQGIFSDCDALSNFVPCVNLSVGYYNAHTESEYTKPADLHRAMQLADRLLTSLPRKNKPFELPEKFDITHEDPGFSKYQYGHYAWNSYGKPIKSTAKAATNSPTTPWIDDCTISIENDGIWLYDDAGDDIFIAENVDDAIGNWDTQIGYLTITPSNDYNDIKATLNDVDIEIEDFRASASRILS